LALQPAQESGVRKVPFDAQPPAARRVKLPAESYRYADHVLPFLAIPLRNSKRWLTAG
jgi:hypothetical protein